MRRVLEWTGGIAVVVVLWISGLVFFALAAAVFVAVLVGISAAIQFLTGV
jgi:hypothetical protein